MYSLLNTIDKFFEKIIFSLLYSINKIENNVKINKNTANRVINGKTALRVTPYFLVLITLLRLSIEVLYIMHQ